jgi:hypothetical protein
MINYELHPFLSVRRQRSGLCGRVVHQQNRNKKVGRFYKMNEQGIDINKVKSSQKNEKPTSGVSQLDEHKHIRAWTVGRN